MNKKIQPVTLHVTARRAELLSIIESGNQDQRSIANKINKSRSTVNKAIRELESLGFVTRNSSMVELTKTGMIALQLLQDVRDDFKQLEGLKDVLSVLPSDIPIEQESMDEFTFVPSTREDPRKPINELKSINFPENRLQALVSSANPYFKKLVGKCRQDQRIRTDLRLPKELSATYRADSTSATHESVDVFDRMVDYSIFIFDEKCAWIGVHIKCGGHMGAIVSRTEKILNWCRETIAEIKN